MDKFGFPLRLEEHKVFCIAILNDLSVLAGKWC